MNVLAFINMMLHITSPTDISGNKLDLVISSKKASISLHTKTIINLINDRFIILFTINIIRPKR